ncbi:MAG: TonB-dependent receptor [Candidatus Kapabacteria bacterium]|nr:TonB-dependent receptor [Candidatus Kapabacteria bacterium]
MSIISAVRIALLLGAFFVCSPLLLLAQTATLRGTVYDRDRAPLTGVTVQIKSLKRGTYSKRDGTVYLKNLPAGTHTVEATLIGYEVWRSTVTMKADETQNISIVMKQSQVKTGTVEVTASRRVQEQTDTRPSVLTVDPREAKYKAGAVEDVFRTLQSLPGVVAPSDFSSQLVVRGSGPDQNLILMDNIEIFNPYRLYGFISLFNPETVSGITLLTGGFNAKYTDRLSAVLDVTNRDGYTGNGYFAGKLNVSLTNANLVTEGALPFWNGSWLVSTRRTYYDLIAGPIARSTGAVDGDVALPNFRDLQFKATFQPHSSLKFFINGLTSRDNTQFQSGANRNNIDSISIVDRSFNDVIGTTFVWLPSDDFTSSLGVSYYVNTGANSFGGQGGSGQILGSTEQVSREDFDRINDTLRARGQDPISLFAVRGETGFTFRKTSVKSDNVWRIDSANTFEFGVQYDDIYTGVLANFDFDPRLRALRASNPRAPALPESFENGVNYFRAGVYAMDNIRLTNELTVQAGVRADYFALIGKSYIAPRLSASFALSPQSTLRGAWGIYYQSPGYEKLFDAQVFLDLTSESVTKLRAERAIHYVLGFDHMLTKEWQFKAEAYYKDFNDLILPEVKRGTIWKTERIAGLPDSMYRKAEGWTTPVAIIGDSLTATPVNSATGGSYGFEVMLQKIQSVGENTIYGWISYSYAISNRFRPGISSPIPFNFDRRHALNIVGGYKAADWLDISATFTYGSGFPWTRPVGIRPRVYVLKDSTTGQATGRVDTDYLGRVVYDVDRGGLENVNQTRLPDYHRLDIRFTTYADWWDWDWSFYLDIINVYNRLNVVAENYRVNRDSLSVNTRQSRMLPILPTLGFSVKF